MVEASQVLLALQVVFFAASAALLLRRPPPLQPPPLPVSEPSGGAERKKKGKAKRQVELGHPTNPTCFFFSQFGSTKEQVRCKDMS
jgi:hypothetical protein